MNFYGMKHSPFLACALALSVVGCAPVQSVTAYPTVSARRFSGEPAFDASRFHVRDSIHRSALLDTVAAQERHWRVHRPPHYSYTVFRSCGCVAELFYAPYRVTVNDDVAVISDSIGRVVRRDPEAVSPLAMTTIFAGLREELERGVPYVQILFDAKYGYPTFSLTDHPIMNDSFFEVKIREFRLR